MPALVRHAEQRGERERRRPERGDVQQVEAPLQAGEQRLAGPERRQQRRDRRLQCREEVRDVRQRLHPQQPLRLDEAQQEDDARREHQAHQHQEITRAPRREHVDDAGSVQPVPTATGITANGTTVDSAVT